jgi:dolichol-phosphate mannosyltransferase
MKSLIIKLCIVIPMYNEEKVAKHNISTILIYTRKLPSDTTVLIVNDGSIDTTEQIIKELISVEKGSKVRMISYKNNRGYGAALRNGIKYALRNKYEYVLFMDSDLTDHPKYLSNFYQKMIERWDYIKGTRKASGGGYKGVAVYRVLISTLGNYCARLITGLPLSDITYGYRAIKCDLLRQINLKESHFAIIIEEATEVGKLTRKICEIPCILGERSEEARQTVFKYNIKTFYKYVKYLF